MNKIEPEAFVICNFTGLSAAKVGELAVVVALIEIVSMEDVFKVNAVGVPPLKPVL